MKEYLVPNVYYYIYCESEDIYQRVAEVIRKTFRYPSYKFKYCTIKLVDVLEEDEQNNIVENYHLGKTNHRTGV